MIRISLLLAFVLSLMAAQASPAAAPAGPRRPTACKAAPQAEMTDVGTPRKETLIVQTFDGKTDNPDNMNPLSGGYSLWRGFRELALGLPLGDGYRHREAYAELAAELPKARTTRTTPSSRSASRKASTGATALSSPPTT